MSAILRCLLENVGPHKDIIFAISSSLMFAIGNLLIYDCGSIFHPLVVALGLSSGMSISSLFYLLVRKTTYPSHERLKSLSLLWLHALLSVLCSFCIISSTINANPGDAVSVQYSSAIFTVVLSVLVLRESFRFTYVVFAMLSIVGVLLITRPEFLFHNPELSEHGNDGKYAIGIIAALAVAVIEAFLFIMYSIIASYNVHPFYIVSSTGLLGVTVITPLSFAILGLWMVDVPFIHFVKLAMVGVLWSSGILLSFLSVREGRPTRVAILNTSEPVFVHIGQYFVFSVYIHWLGYIGTACIAAACIGVGVLNNTEPNKERPHKDLNADEDTSLVKKNEFE